MDLGDFLFDRLMFFVENKFQKYLRETIWWRQSCVFYVECWVADECDVEIVEIFCSTFFFRGTKVCVIGSQAPILCSMCNR